MKPKFKTGDRVWLEFNNGSIKIRDAIIIVSPYGGTEINHNDDERYHNGCDVKNGYKYCWNISSNHKGLRHEGEEIKPMVYATNRHNIGCDPEFFFMKNGEVLGSETFIPKEGIQTTRGKLTIDGVQAEINPSPDTCRERLYYSIAELMSKAKGLCTDGVSISFDPCVPIKLKYLDTLSEKAKVFGCTPSDNIYVNDNKMSITDSSKYPFRPAGGHIHIGHDTSPEMKAMTNDLGTLIPMLDIIVGNTCVLVDRHEGNVERRKCYGRAGEFRTPKHGVEYRTLSNFWMKSYPLMSMAFGLVRLTISIIISSNKEKGYNFVEQIMGAVDQQDIIKAINNNDFDLALKNFSKIRPILEKILEVNNHSLDAVSIPYFLHFVGKIKTHGLEYWFKGDQMEKMYNYIHRNGDRGFGWENFLAVTVKADMGAKKTIAGKILKKLNLD